MKKGKRKEKGRNGKEKKKIGVKINYELQDVGKSWIAKKNLASIEAHNYLFAAISGHNFSDSLRQIL